jgi:TonB family protein
MFTLRFSSFGTLAATRKASIGAMATLWFLASFAPFANAQVSANFPTEILFNPAEESWARVTRIVPPAYPKEALKNGTGAVVDITVLVGEDGLVKEVRRVVATPPDPQFENATREVLKFWGFRQPLTSRCQPVEIVGDVRLTFSVVDGKEEIALSHRALPQGGPQGPSTKDRADPSLVPTNYKEAIRDIRYPPAARRAGVQADVWARATFSRASGLVTEAEATYVATFPAGDDKAFRQTAVEAVKKLKLEPKPDLPGDLVACVPLTFRLQ